MREVDEPLYVLFTLGIIFLFSTWSHNDHNFRRKTVIEKKKIRTSLSRNVALMQPCSPSRNTGMLLVSTLNIYFSSFLAAVLTFVHFNHLDDAAFPLCLLLKVSEWCTFCYIVLWCFFRRLNFVSSDQRGASGNQTAALGYVVQAPGLVVTPLEWTAVLSLLSNPQSYYHMPMSYKRHPLARDLTYTWRDKRARVRRFLLLGGCMIKDTEWDLQHTHSQTTILYLHTFSHSFSPHNVLSHGFGLIE